MAPFQDRSLRVAVSFPVTYFADSARSIQIAGACLNISESGLLAVFNTDLELWTKGEIVLRFGEGALGLKVRVARVDGKQTGMVFLFENAEQRSTIADVVASAIVEMKQKGHFPDIPF